MRASIPAGRYPWLIWPLVGLTLILFTSLNIGALKDHVFERKHINFDIVVLSLVILTITFNYIPGVYWSRLFDAIVSFIKQISTRLKRNIVCPNPSLNNDELQATVEELQPLRSCMIIHSNEQIEAIENPLHAHPAGVSFNNINRLITADVSSITILNSLQADFERKIDRCDSLTQRLYLESLVNRIRSITVSLLEDGEQAIHAQQIYDFITMSINNSEFSVHLDDRLKATLIDTHRSIAAICTKYAQDSVISIEESGNEQSITNGCCPFDENVFTGSLPFSISP